MLVLPRFCLGFVQFAWQTQLKILINEGAQSYCVQLVMMHETRQRTLQKYDHGLLLQPNATVARIGPKLCANAILDQNEKQTLSGEAKLLLGFHWFLSLNQHML